MTDHQVWKERLSAYFDDELSPEDKDIVNNHLVDCPACQKYLQELQKLSLSVKNLKNESLSADLEQRLNEHLNRTRTRGTEMDKPTFFKIAKTVVPVAVIVVLLTFSLQVYIKRGVQGRMHTAADDIGEQYSVGNTSLTKTIPTQMAAARIRDAAKYMVKESPELGTTNQYEAYYQSASYAVDGKSKGDRRESSLKPANAALAARSAVVGSSLNFQAPAAAPAEKKSEVTWNDTAYYNSPIVKNRIGQIVDKPTSEYDAVLRQRGGVYPYVQAQLQESNREQYDLINENEFLAVTENPLSTFSIDVDTASYSNIRRMLTNNQLPPRDSVRIEEMINYFKYDYPPPAWNQPFSITLEHSLCPWDQRHQLVLVGLQGKQISEQQTPASNLVFLIDVSGSMNEPNKLPLLKDSLKMMVQELRAEERISMVVYAGNAGLVLNSTPGYNKQVILSAIDNLQAGGSTAGGQGIQLAYDVARQNFIKNGNNRVILATDGDFNVGVSSDAELVQLIEEERKSGIFLTVLGLGTGNLQDAKMEKLADKGNGNYYYIDTLAEGKKVLVDELGSTIFTIAKDVKIQIEFNPKAVKAYRLIGYENRKLAKEDFNDDTKDAGELGAGHTVTALYEIIPAGSWEGTKNVDSLKYQRQEERKSIFSNDKEMMTVKLRYKEPNSDNSQLITRVLNRPANILGTNWFNGGSDNLQFASAVAEFGMLLRGSNFKGGASYQDVIQRAQASQYNDPWGYKSEFIGLVQQAASLDNRVQNPIPQSQDFNNQGHPIYRQGGYNQK